MSERLHLPGDHPGDWPEDFPHDNGCYMNRCVGCGLIFHGHKRRVECKVCATARGVSRPAAPLVSEPAVQPEQPQSQQPQSFHQTTDCVVRTVQAALSESHAQLAKFYGVDSLAALVDMQARHIEKLQAKLPQAPNVFAPQRVREG